MVLRVEQGASHLAMNQENKQNGEKIMFNFKQNEFEVSEHRPNESNRMPV